MTQHEMTVIQKVITALNEAVATDEAAEYCYTATYTAALDVADLLDRLLLDTAP